jgi:hypothetical protein
MIVCESQKLKLLVSPKWSGENRLLIPFGPSSRVSMLETTRCPTSSFHGIKESIFGEGSG